MKILSIIVSIIFFTGCSSILAPPAGTHYTVKYGEIEISVDDWTDRDGIEFEYITKDAKVVLKKESVDTSTPAAVLQQKQAENQSKALEVISGLIKK